MANLRLEDFIREAFEECGYTRHEIDDEFARLSLAVGSAWTDGINRAVIFFDENFEREFKAQLRYYITHGGLDGVRLGLQQPEDIERPQEMKRVGNGG